MLADTISCFDVPQTPLAIGLPAFTSQSTLSPSFVACSCVIWQQYLSAARHGRVEGVELTTCSVPNPRMSDERNLITDPLIAASPVRSVSFHLLMRRLSKRSTHHTRNRYRVTMVHRSSAPRTQRGENEQTEGRMRQSWTFVVRW